MKHVIETSHGKVSIEVVQRDPASPARQVKLSVVRAGIPFNTYITGAKAGEFAEAFTLAEEECGAAS